MRVYLIDLHPELIEIRVLLLLLLHGQEVLGVRVQQLHRVLLALLLHVHDTLPEIDLIV